MRPNAEASSRLFAALGDETRLRLVVRLSDAGPMSITRLTAGSRVTRQAITKHLRMMEQAGLVRSARRGRERVWQLERRRLEQARRYLDQISQHVWGGLRGRRRPRACPTNAGARASRSNPAAGLTPAVPARKKPPDGSASRRPS